MLFLVCLVVCFVVKAFLYIPAGEPADKPAQNPGKKAKAKAKGKAKSTKPEEPKTLEERVCGACTLAAVYQLFLVSHISLHSTSCQGKDVKKEYMEAESLVLDLPRGPAALTTNNILLFHLRPCR